MTIHIAKLELKFKGDSKLKKIVIEKTEPAALTTSHLNKMMTQDVISAIDPETGLAYAVRLSEVQMMRVVQDGPSSILRA